MDSLQKGAIGAEIVVDFLNVDITGATVTLSFRKPNGVKIGPYAASLFTDTDTRVKAKYITPSSSFLDRSGTWAVQGNVTLSGYDGPSEIGNFEVIANL